MGRRLPSSLSDLESLINSLEGRAAVVAERTTPRNTPSSTPQGTPRSTPRRAGDAGMPSFWGGAGDEGGWLWSAPRQGSVALLTRSPHSSPNSPHSSLRGGMTLGPRGASPLGRGRGGGPPGTGAGRPRAQSDTGPRDLPLLLGTPPPGPRVQQTPPKTT